MSGSWCVVARWLFTKAWYGGSEGVGFKLRVPKRGSPLTMPKKPPARKKSKPTIVITNLKVVYSINGTRKKHGYNHTISDVTILKQSRTDPAIISFFTSNRKNTDNDNHDESQKEDATAKNTQTLNLKP